MKTEKLSSITREIVSGFSPARAKDLGKGSIVKSISIKDIRPETLELDGDELGEDLDLGDKSFIKKFALKPDDLVMTAKGTCIRAAIFKGSSHKVLPNSNLIKIKCDESIILPTYLAIFLNLESTTNEIRSKQAGTTIMSLSVKELSNLPISIPSLEEQGKIITLFKEGERFCKAREDEIKNMKLLLQSSLYQILNRSEV